MNIALHESTGRVLEAFRRRRQRLLWCRAGLSLVMVTLSACIIIAILDRVRFMPEVVRPWVTLIAYAGGLWVAWKVALRFLALARDENGVARLVETAEPKLREQLLAAVELARTDATDSVEFREQLQARVAAELEKLDLKATLPASALRPWFVAIGAAVAVIVGLSLVPNLNLPGFLVRAAVPFADLERPSNVKISIIEPSPASTVAPLASDVGVVVELEGPAPEVVMMETQGQSGRVLSTALNHMIGSRYEGVITVGQGDVKYRLIAGDSVTSWYTLSGKARPRVVEFRKVIVPPAYSELSETSITDDHGDIEALDGSTVKLLVKTNQPVSRSEMQVNPEQPNRRAPVEVKPNNEGLLAAELFVRPENSSWQLVLTSQETGFTNEQTSPWQITAIPDLPPVVRITQPQEQLELLADESVKLSGTAGDDVGLASVKMAFAINGADWRERELVGKSGKETKVDHVLPLGPLQVRPGDTLVIKLIATDLKGQRAESPPVRVIILEQTIDPRLRIWAAETRKLALQSRALMEEAKELAKAVPLIQSNPKKDNAIPNGMNRSNDALARVQTQLEQVSGRADDLWEALKVAARSAPNALAASEVRLLGDKLSQMRRESLTALKEQTHGETQNTALLRRSANEASSIAELLAQATRLFATEDSARILAQSARHLQRQETLLTDNALAGNRDASQRPKWQEQQRAAIVATENVRKEMASLKTVADSGAQRQIDDLDKRVHEAAVDLKDSLDKEGQTKSPEHLYGAADNLRQRLNHTSETAEKIAETAASQAAQIRERLQRQNKPALAALEQAKNSLQTASAEAKGSRKPPKVDKEGMTALQRAEKQLATAAKQMEDQGTLREQMLMGDEKAVLDANRSSRAAQQLADEVKKLPAQQAAIASVQNKANQLFEAARMLEADALIQTATRASLEAASQPDPGRAASPTDPAEQARAATEALGQLTDTLRKMKVPDETLTSEAQAAVEASRVASEQLQNLGKQAATQPISPESLRSAQDAALLAEQKASELASRLAEQANAARQSLAGLTPQISEMMKAVAEDLKQTLEQTQAAAQEAQASKPVDEVAKQAGAIQPEAEKNAQKMEALQAALRQEANAANLSEAEQRRMARMADVALSQMQKKSPQIAQNLRQATQATESQQQADALQSAADAQQQTAEGLEQLAQNMAKAEQGQALTDQELAAMEALEKDLEVKDSLDEAYKRAEELGKLIEKAHEDPAAALAALEKELASNSIMKKALAELSKQTAQIAEESVAAEAAQPSNIGLATEQAAHDLARVARHEKRLGQEEVAKQTAQVSAQLEQSARAAKGKPGEPQQPVNAASQTAAAQAVKAAETVAAATPPAPVVSPFEQVQGAMLAQALDQLDQTVNPKLNQSGQPQPQEGGQQSAEQKLADAQQQQQKQMANQRSQGQAPGSKQKGQQTAQKSGEQPQQSSNPGQPTGEGNIEAQLQDGTLNGELIMVRGDWGHLPSKMAEDLTEATRAEAAPEYRAAIESYYKAIATKARKP